MIHLKPHRQGGFVATMPLPPDSSTEKGEPHLRIHIDYTLGGAGAFGQVNSRGIYIHVTPVRMSEGMMSCTLMSSLAKSGAKILARGQARRSAKAEAEVAELIDPLIPELVALWKDGQHDAVFTTLREKVGPATKMLPPPKPMVKKSLLTAELRATIPVTAEGDDPIVQCKFFTPDGAATWLVLEFDGDDTFYGWVTLGLGPDCDELGTFSLQELESLRGKLGLPVERDKFFKPCPLSEAMKRHQMAGR